METGVVVYDSERPVCREMDGNRDRQWQGERDKEQDSLTRSMYQWLHVDGIKSPSFEGTVSIYWRNVHWCLSRKRETEVRCSGSEKWMYMCGVHALTPQILRESPSLLITVHFPRLTPLTATSSKVNNHRDERRRDTKRGKRNKVALSSAGEGDGPWLIVKTLYYLFKKPWS